MTSSEDLVRELLHSLADRRSVAILPGLNTHDMEALSNSLGIEIPFELREWLSICNAPRIIRGRLLGITLDNPATDIHAQFERHPAWKERGWIPVAVDAFGNPFVLAAHSTRPVVGTPVLFVEHDVSLDEPAYVVASGLWRFLWFLLEHELQLDSLGALALSDEDWDAMYDRMVGWPFDKSTVLARDQEILHCDDAPMPWDVADAP